MEKQGHWNEIIALGQEHQLTFSSLFVEVPLFQGGGRGKGIYFQLCIKHAMLLNRKPEVNISNAKAVVSPRFSN